MPATNRTDYIRLLTVSFLMLFLELMLIRWVPGVIRLVAYYTNLLLISSFLGLGIGLLLSRRMPQLFRAFPALLLVNVGVLLLVRQFALPGSPLEFRFFEVAPQLANYLVLVGIFIANTAVFVPLGTEIGRLFERLPTLKAYSWDLLGSLAGTVGFGVFAYYTFSPVAGAIVVAVLYLALVARQPRQLALSVPLLGASILLMRPDGDIRPIWSPYYHVTIEDVAGGPTEPPPVETLRTMVNPPFYLVRVNQDFYQFHGSIDPQRYTPDHPLHSQVSDHQRFHLLSFQLQPGSGDVLVMGAGGGPEVEAALLAGAHHVDAVDIDPVLIDLSRRYSAAGVYDDPRVSVHIDDARAYLRRAARQYDVVVFGFLDSQGLSSAMASIRLDSYVYTVESMREAFSLLKEDGLLTLSFASGNQWMVEKLAAMLHEATDREVAVYTSDGSRFVFAVAQDSTRTFPVVQSAHQRLRVPRGELRPPTDDWPYLYLAYPTIPGDYLVVIGTLFALSLGMLLALRGGAGNGAAPQWEFGFLGAAFLLLQTKSIVDCALYFGATWFVTTVVICGVLLMVFLANLLAMRLRTFRYAFYLPLIASLLVLYLVPREWVLYFPFAGRLAWTLLVVPLPIFFAGLIFSTRFKATQYTAAALGANLIGAMAGGFLEYTGMVVGSRALLLLVVAIYLCSFLAIRTRDARAGAKARESALSTPAELPA